MPSMLTVTSQVARAMWGGLTDPRISTGRKLAVLGGFLGSGVRLAHATVIGKLGPRPEQPLVLWDFERSAQARAVREALSVLDLDAEIRPCPPPGTRFGGELEGKQVPCLRDPNTGETIEGPRAIVAHLYRHYGAGRPPWLLNLGPVLALTGWLVTLLTAGRGGRPRASRAPEKPLELWSFESSPYCRLARAALSELELPYLLHNVAKGSKRRTGFVARSGRMQVPYLFDPNTGAALFESQAIEQYLASTYGL